MQKHLKAGGGNAYVRSENRSVSEQGERNEKEKVNNVTNNERVPAGTNKQIDNHKELGDKVCQ
jgi:hypothetical protein